MASENSGPSTDARLREILSSIYDFLHATMEIKALETKLDSLTSIRTALTKGDNISPTNLDQMNITINELKSNISKRKQEIVQAEKLVIGGFTQVITDVSKGTQSIGEEVMTRCSEAVKSFAETMRLEINTASARTETALGKLASSKMDKSELDEIRKHMEDYKETIVEIQKSNMTKMHADSTALFKTISEKISQQCDLTQITATVEQRVFSKLDDQLKGKLEAIHSENQKAINATNEKVGSIPGTITNAVKKLISDNISPTNMQRLIQGLPEYQAMKNAGSSLVKSPTEVDPQHLPTLGAIRESVVRLTSDLVELKESAGQTRSIVDVMRTQRVGPINVEPEKFDYLVAMKRMEDMEREVTVIHNNVKMMETLINFKSKTIEDQQPVVGNKRARIEGASSAENVNTEIIDMMNDLELKHQKLVDFILQCKDNVLDDMFTSRLEAAMKKIEQVLVNHERFISFLVDPFTTAQQKPKISTAQVPEGTLSPAMIAAISQLVQKTAKEASEPLEKKIKYLEDQLKSRT